MKSVEINGVVVEFDEKAFLKQEIKIGSPVSILRTSSYDDPKIYKGVVVDIIPFKEDDPAICVMWIEETYSEIQIRQATITSQTENYRIVSSEGHFLPYSKETALDLLDRDIEKKRYELEKAKEKKAYFLKYYNQFIRPIAESDTQEV